jgi:hypothetical protein
MTGPDDDRALTRLLTEHVPDPPERLRRPPGSGLLAARLHRRRAGTAALAAAAVVLVTAAGYGAAVTLRPDRGGPAAPTTPPPRTPANHPIEPVSDLDKHGLLVMLNPGTIDPTDHLLRVGLEHRGCDDYTLHAVETPATVRLFLTGAPVSGDCDRVLDTIAVRLQQPLSNRHVRDPLGQPVPVLHERDRLYPGYLPPGVGDLIDLQPSRTTSLGLRGQGWLYTADNRDLTVRIRQCFGSPAACGRSGDVVARSTVHLHPAEILKSAAHVTPQLELQWEANGYTFTIGVEFGRYDQDEMIRQAQLIANNLY